MTQIWSIFKQMFENTVHFQTDFEAPQDKSAMVICWDSAFKKVPPQMLQERPTVAVFESVTDDTSVEELAARMVTESALARQVRK